VAKKKQAKAKKKKKKSSSGGGGASGGDSSTGGRSRELDLILASLDAPVRTEGPISDDEKARRHEIGRNYVIGRFRQHNELDHDLTCKLHMKQHAIKMLPRNSKIREEALTVTMDGPPAWRHPPSWTPPIPDFDPSRFVEKDED